MKIDSDHNGANNTTTSRATDANSPAAESSDTLKPSSDESNGDSVVENGDENDSQKANSIKEEEKSTGAGDKSGQELIFIHDTCFNIKIEAPNSDTFTIPVSSARF